MNKMNIYVRFENYITIFDGRDNTKRQTKNKSFENTFVNQCRELYTHLKFSNQNLRPLI